MTALPAALANAEIPSSVRRVLERLVERGFRAFLVGGCVRDLVRGVLPKDFDVATSARPEQVVQSFPKVVPTGIQHGTVTVLFQGTPVEVTTFRSEAEYLDGRRPSAVAFHTEIEADLSRRDFTINAMAFDPVRQELCDPFGGQADLQLGLIRCVGRPIDRFSEDGLRPLRAIRFAAVLGFQIESDTLQAISATVAVFRQVSMERVREEFVRVLQSSRASEGIELLRSTGLLREFLPELVDLVGVDQGPRYSQDAWGHSLSSLTAVEETLELRLAALLHDVAKPRCRSVGPTFPEHDLLGAELTRQVLTRLKFPTRTIEAVAHLVRHHVVEGTQDWSDARVRRFVARVGQDSVEALLNLCEANRIAYGKDIEPALAELRNLRARVAQVLSARHPLTPKALALDGRGIMASLGVGPSPLVGEASRFLMEQVLEHPELNTPSALRELLSAWSAAQRRG